MKLLDILWKLTLTVKEHQHIAGVSEKVASDLCTIYDAGTIPHERGSINFDDEGVPSSENLLIEKGVLKLYARPYKCKDTSILIQQVMDAENHMLITLYPA